MRRENENNDTEPEDEPGPDASRQAPESPKPNTTGKKDWH
jgi:hypothetical protein